MIDRRHGKRLLQTLENQPQGMNPSKAHFRESISAPDDSKRYPNLTLMASIFYGPVFECIQSQKIFLPPLLKLCVFGEFADQ